MTERASLRRDRRLYLSPPQITEIEKALVVDALDSGWVAPVGPHIDAFEDEVATFVGAEHAVALSSGTAALHMGLLALGVGAGDDVLVPTLTFGATAFAVTYTGARPLFVDSEPESWNIDPTLVAEYLDAAAKRGRLPKAVVPVDLFGRTANYDQLLPICDKYELPVLIDAAEAMGAWHGDQAAGSLGQAGVFSFNGNKIITTSGGGMIVTNDPDLANRVRHLSTQARLSLPWYEHLDIGFNYRMSNILAALGRGQLSRLPDIVRRRRQIQAMYGELLGSVADVGLDPSWGRSNGWLTVARLRDSRPGAVTDVLAKNDIEARRVWKPMHLQPVFSSAPILRGEVAENLFDEGVCLPTGQAMSGAEVQRVASLVVESTTKHAQHFSTERQ